MIKVINNGADVKKISGKYKDVRKKYGISKKTIMLSYAASLTRPHLKGQFYLIDMMKEIMEAGIDAKLVIAGDGEIRKEMEQMSRRRGVDKNIIFAGDIDYVPDLLRSSDIFVFVSLKEGMPLAVVEAMAAGLPVAAFRAPGVADIVKGGRTGMLARAGDVKGIAKAVIKLAKDKKLRKKFGTAGKKLAFNNFSIKKTVSAYTGLYRKCAEEYSRKGEKK